MKISEESLNALRHAMERAAPRAQDDVDIVDVPTEPLARPGNWVVPGIFALIAFWSLLGLQQNGRRARPTRRKKR